MTGILERTIPGQPVLSLIVCSRNDNYQGGALVRLQTGLNLTARTIHELGLQDAVEIILSDWGSERPLREVLCLTPEAAGLLWTLEVPKPVAEKYQRDAPFSEVHALNAAARRARGEYIGRIDQDTILGRRFFDRFFGLIQGESSLEVPLERALMLSNRRGVPYRLASTGPAPWVIQRFIRWFGRIAPLAKPLPEPLYYQSYVGIWLIHRNLWFEIGGYDESFIYINWMEVDMILRLEAKYRFVNFGKEIQHEIYHLDHMHPFAEWGAGGRVRKENPVRDRDHLPKQQFPNSDDWGLASEPLQFTPYRLKPGEAAAAREPMERPRWGAFLWQTARCGVRSGLDQLALSVIKVLAAGLGLLLALAPSLRERLSSYRVALRGRPLSHWPRLAREHGRARRAEKDPPSSP